MDELNELRKASEALNSVEPKWTTEEAVMSTPYSEAEVWRNLLEQQFLDGGRRFNGPPGMWGDIVSRLSKPV